MIFVFENEFFFSLSLVVLVFIFGSKLSLPMGKRNRGPKMRTNKMGGGSLNQRKKNFGPKNKLINFRLYPQKKL